MSGFSKRSSEQVEQCECGHAAESHFMEQKHRRCQATVYTEAPLGGGNAYTCHCRDYVPATGAEHSPSAERTEVERLRLALTRAMDRGNELERAFQDAIFHIDSLGYSNSGRYLRELLEGASSLDSEQK